MRKRATVLAVAVFAAWSDGAVRSAGAVGDERIQSVDEAMESVSVEDVRVANGQVMGRVVNRTSGAVSNVRLRVLFSWRWKNETRPGHDDMSTGQVETVPGEIPPGAAVDFSYPLPPRATERTDGYYHIEVNVAGFSVRKSSGPPS